MTGNFNTTEARALVERLTGYTEGPWTFEMEQDEWPELELIGGAGDTVLSFDFDLGFGVHDANARLIAAAPDLHRHLTAALAENERLQEIERLVLAANTLREEYHALPNERLRPGSKESRKSRSKRLWLKAFNRAVRKALKGADQ